MPGLPLVHSPHPTIPLIVGVASHVATGLFMSPLDLVRTRLIVQSAQPRHRKYKGPIHALRTIADEEGGLGAMFLHANLLLPTVFDCACRGLVHIGVPLLIERALRIPAAEQPVAYALAEFLFNTAALLVLLPIETVRRRLQVQSRARVQARSPFRACVEIRPSPYAGIVETFYRIWTEETSSVPRHLVAPRHRHRGEGVTEEVSASAASASASGFRQLYRGFGVGVASNAIVFILSLVTSGDERISGWAEM